MKYCVSIFNTRSYEYHVVAPSGPSGKEEAKALANELHNNPKTKNSPISDWDYDVEEDNSDWENE
ncbi:MAG: hypothetical protein ACXAEN_16655 [Candidatus Thorarchaeota archaeon]|jgi:hypothetical protein